MDIKSLHSKFFTNNETDKVQRGDKAAIEPQSSSSSSSAQKSQESDKLSLGNVAFSGDVDLARSVLQNLREHSFENLRHIKANIDNGIYNSDDMIDKLANNLQNGVTNVDSVAENDATANLTESSKIQLNDELRDRLLRDSEVLDRISSRILDDLSNL